MPARGDEWLVEASSGPVVKDGDTGRVAAIGVDWCQHRPDLADRAVAATVVEEAGGIGDATIVDRDHRVGELLAVMIVCRDEQSLSTQTTIGALANRAAEVGEMPVVRYLLPHSDHRQDNTV